MDEVGCVNIFLSEGAGVAEIVADGRTGCLVRSADTAAFAIALGELLQNEVRRKAFSAAAWDWVAREFRVGDMVEAYLTLYRDLVETPSR